MTKLWLRGDRNDKGLCEIVQVTNNSVCMNKTITLCLLACMGSAAAHAQQLPDAYALKNKMLEVSAHTAPASQAKTTAVMQRLSGSSYIDHLLQYIDTSVYFYSHNRGSDFDYDQMRYFPYLTYSAYTQGAMVYYDSFSRGPVPNNYARVYDAAGHVLSETQYSPGGSRYRTNCTYDAQGHMTELADDAYDPFTMAWTPGNRTRYVYDATGRLASDTIDTHNGTGFVVNYYASFHYNSSNLVDTATYYSYNGSSWQTSGRTTSTYGTGTKPVSMLFESYNGTGWDNTARLLYTYAGNQRLSEVYALWMSNSWVNWSEDYRHLNAAGRPDSVFLAMYDGMVWDTTISKVVYNSFDNPVTIDYSQPSGAFEGQQRFYYQEYDPTGIKEPAVAKALTVYPNPAGDVLHVAAGQLREGSVAYEVINSLGQKVIAGREEPSGRALSIDVSRLAPGMYRLHLQDAGGQHYQCGFSK